MSIIIKKKPKYNKKKILQRVIFLVIIYFTSFFSLYAIFGEKPIEENQTDEIVEQITYRNDGEKFLAEKKYFSAIEFYHNVLSKNPEDFLSMTKLANAYKNISEFEKAKFYAYKSKQLAPYYPDNYIEAAHVYILQKDYLNAERAINRIPVKTKEDFIKKANILIILANAETNFEDKIVHYDSALKYYKKYDKKLYDKNVDFLVRTYFNLIDYFKSQKDYESAIIHYSKVKKIKDDSITNNKLAKAFLDISKLHSIRALITAVKKAETQEEKRLTKETIINFRHYFEATGENDLIQLTKTLLDLLDESTILVNENFMPYQIKDDKFELIEKNNEIYPKVDFAVYNNSEKTLTSLYVKVEMFIKSSKILDSNMAHIILKDVPLKSKATSDLYRISLNMPLDVNKRKPYTITLSLSENGKDWYLFRIYKSK